MIPTPQPGRRHAAAVFVAIAALLPGAHAQDAPRAAGAPPAAPVRDVRWVVLHLPGPAWQPGKGMFEQPGVREHVEHYRKLLAAGKLALGGPHLDARGGGMMIPAAGVTEAEIRQFAADDPAVRSGLLVAEVRPWLIGMRP